MSRAPRVFVDADVTLALFGDTRSAARRQEDESVAGRCRKAEQAIAKRLAGWGSRMMRCSETVLTHLFASASEADKHPLPGLAALGVWGMA